MLHRSYLTGPQVVICGSGELVVFFSAGTSISHSIIHPFPLISPVGSVLIQYVRFALFFGLLSFSFPMTLYILCCLSLVSAVVLVTFSGYRARSCVVSGCR